jgi:hypothetical protein
VSSIHLPQSYRGGVITQTGSAPVIVGVDGSRSSLGAVSVVEAERRGAVAAAPEGEDDPRRVDTVTFGAARVARWSTTGEGACG